MLQDRSIRDLVRMPFRKVSFITAGSPTKTIVNAIKQESKKIMATSAQINSLAGLYAGYFNRAPDPSGLQFWIDQIDGGRAFDTIAADFAASTEATGLYPFLTAPDVATPSTFITSIYQNLFNRAPDSDGLAFWSDVLAAKSVSVGDMIAAIINGAVDAPDATPPTFDKATLDNKIEVGLDWAVSAGNTTGFTFDAAAKTAAKAAIDDVTNDEATVTAAKAETDTFLTSTTVVAGQTFTLTTGADTGAAFIGKAGDDIFNASEIAGNKTWTVGDAIDGGAGNDTFNVTQTAAITIPVGATVKNIETMKALSGTTGNVLDTTAFTGLTALNVTGVTAQTVTAAATTDVSVTGSTATGATAVNGGKAVSVTETGASGGTVNIGATTAAAGAVTVNSTILATAGSTGNGITVKGGTEISVTQKGANAVNTTVTDGGVTITGDANTKSVTVTNDKAATAAAAVVGHVNGAVSVTDVNAASTTAAGVIETVTLNSFAAATVNSGALTTLNLSGTGTSVAAGTLGALTTAANTALALNLTGATTTGAVTIDSDIKTLNVSGNTTASTLNSLVASGATKINVSGDAKVTFTGNTTAAVTDIVVTNTGGASFGTALAAGVAFTGGAGADAVSLGATTKAITMGAGDDTVTSAGLVGTGGSVAAGDGTDTIVMTSAEAAVADNDATFNSKFTGFETLRVSNQLAATTTLNLTGINAVSTVELAAGSAAADSIISNLASGGTVKLLADSTNLAVQVKDATFNAADVLNLNLSKSGALLAAGTITAAGVETINISAADAATAGSAAAINTMTLTAANATTITVSGNNGLNLTATGSTAVTTFDASGVVGNGTADTAANLAVTYASLNTSAATITGGAGNDTLTGNSGNDTIKGGAGTDSITGGQGADVLTGGTGADTFIFSTNGSVSGTSLDKITDFNTGGSDILDFAATGVLLAAESNGTTATSDVDTTAGGKIVFAAADDTFAKKVVAIQADTQLDAIASVAFFEDSGNSYVYYAGAAIGNTDDQIVELTGVVGLTTITVNGGGDLTLA